MIEFKHTGDFKNAERFFSQATKINLANSLEKYAQEGVAALASATPVDSGETATSWDYVIKINKSSFGITWTNSNVVDGVPVAILIQYGHGTKNGGYVQGRDFINPAMTPIFDRIANNMWKEVINI